MVRFEKISLYLVASNTYHKIISSVGNAVASPDVILSGANMYLYYTSFEQPSTASYFPVSLKMVESNFISATSDKVTREDFMQVLQNLTAIYIKASYIEKGDVTRYMNCQLCRKNYHL